MVRRLPDSWSNWNLEMLVFEERGKTEYPEKNLRSKGENQQQTQPTYGVDAGIRTRATLVGGERSHHCSTLAPLDTEDFYISRAKTSSFHFIIYPRGSLSHHRHKSYNQFFAAACNNFRGNLLFRSATSVLIPSEYPQKLSPCTAS